MAVGAHEGLTRPGAHRRSAASGARRTGFSLTVRLVGLGLPLVVGLVHVLVVWQWYFVGSFDDDAGYVLGARALAHGHGLTSVLPSGSVLAGQYPPGFAALLSPLVAVWPHTFTPLRLSSVVFYAAIFPLVWWYLGRRGLGPRLRSAVLWVLALDPVLATYGSMIMAETAFLVGLLVLLLLAERWDGLEPGAGDRRARLATGTAVVLVAGAEVWLKEAGIGVVAGLALWQVWRRRPRRAVTVAGGAALLLSPVVVARLVAGTPVIGSRYSEELGGYYTGGLLGRLVNVAPSALHQMVSTAVPNTLVPYGSPLPSGTNWFRLGELLGLHVSILVLIGAVTWWRRHRDAAVMVVGVYLAETLLWPDINERRVILVLPIVAAWYVLGARTVFLWVRGGRTARSRTARPPTSDEDRAPARHRRPTRPWVTPTVAVVAAVIVVAPLIAQFSRDYLYGEGQVSSRPQGSRYMAFLAHLGRPSDVVESDYQSTTALFSGHRTADTAFVNDLITCTLATTTAAVAADHAGYLLLGNLNKPGLIDGPCLAGQVGTQTWAVPLLHTTLDDATVFELVGPGTAHPGLTNAITSAAATGPDPTAPAPGRWEWDWTTPQPITQVSVDRAGTSARTTSVTVALREPGRGWVTVAASRSVVGGHGGVPFLLTTLPHPTAATALRVDIDGAGTPGLAGVAALATGGGG